MQRRHLISIEDLSTQELRDLLARSVTFATGAAADQPLRGRVIGIYFRKTSTRTRTAFSAGALRLGAQIVSYGPNDLQENTGETIEDTTHVLSRMLDGLVARTAGSTEEMKALAAQDRMAVINAMSAREHPTQALADLTTLHRQFGRIEELRVLYVGEGNNTAAALALAMAHFRGCELRLHTPAGYGMDPAVITQAIYRAQQTGARISESHQTADLPRGFDVVYTTRWQTTGTSKPDPEWRASFVPFRVDPQMMAAHPRAVLMHDLPAHRGEEVEAAVLDGPTSIAFAQAENKLYSAMAALAWCIGDRESS